MPCPESVEHLSADTIAETVGYHEFLTESEAETLYVKLWNILGDAEEARNATPLGGDGSDGTVEYPDARWGTSEDDKPGQFWDKLTEREQNAILRAIKKEDARWNSIGSESF